MSVPKPPWIEITTIVPCPIRCSYCPQDTLIASYQGEGVLTLSRFAEVLKNISRDVTIDFSGFAEPFTNPECADMILLGHELGYKIGVNSTLVGLGEKNAQRIAHIPFAFFYQHDIGLDLPVYPFVERRSKVENPESRSGNLRPELRREGVGECKRSPTHEINVMLPDGTVVLCCNDYGLKHCLGNLFNTRYEQLTREVDYELCHRCPHWAQTGEIAK